MQTATREQIENIIRRSALVYAGNPAGQSIFLAYCLGLAEVSEASAAEMQKYLDQKEAIIQAVI